MLVMPEVLRDQRDKQWLLTRSQQNKLIRPIDRHPAQKMSPGPKCLGVVICIVNVSTATVYQYCVGGYTGACQRQGKLVINYLQVFTEQRFCTHAVK